jgi:hypothetical protein
VERFRDRVQDHLEFQVLLEPGLAPDGVQALVNELRQDVIWRDVRAVSPAAYFHNLPGLSDWMSDDANKDIVGAMSFSLRLKPRDILRAPSKALDVAQTLRGHGGIREVYTEEDTVKRLYLNFEFWKNTAVLMEWVSFVFCLLVAWLLRRIKHKILVLHPLESKSQRVSRAVWLRFLMGVQKALFFGAVPLICLLALYVFLDYTAAPMFHSLAPVDPLFPLSFLPIPQVFFFWVLGGILWWTISNPMRYKAERS